MSSKFFVNVAQYAAVLLIVLTYAICIVDFVGFTV